MKKIAVTIFAALLILGPAYSQNTSPWSVSPQTFLRNLHSYGTSANRVL